MPPLAITLRSLGAALLCILLAHGASAGTLTARTLSHDGLIRSYLEYVPSSVPAGPLPLVLVLHGGSESANTAAGTTRPSGHWRVIADRDGVIVAFPDGVGGNWNDCGQTALTGTPSTAEDVGFMRKLAADISGRMPIDQQRIYATGASNGGLMSYRLAQEASETFAGVAGFIALRPQDPAGECRAPVNASTVIVEAGTSDNLIRFDGSGTRNESYAATRSYWLQRLACSGTPLLEDYLDINPSDGSTVAAERWQSCAGDSSLHLLVATGAGHITPSVLYPIATAPLLGGPQNRDLEAAEEAWKILRDVTLGVDRWFVGSFE
jgi:polyhydroxybutyrate depolymerase